MFDYTFVCLTDTYVVPARLMSSGFAGYDYIGSANGERTQIGGGPGMWLSYKAAERLVSSSVTNWAYDRWVGKVMLDNSISLKHDFRYTNLDLGDEPPMPTNSNISSHISNCDRSTYSMETMFDLHCQYKGMSNV